MNRQTVSTLSLSLIGCLIATLCCNSVAEAQERGKPPKGKSPYSIIPFSPPSMTSTASRVYGLNDQGHAVGDIVVGSGTQAVHLDIATGDYTLLSGTTASDVNNLNQIVGSETDISAAFWASPEATPVSLPPLEDDLISVATAINDGGIVLGFSEPGVSGSWTPVGVAWRVVVQLNGSVLIDGPVRLAPLAPATSEYSSIAVDINEIANGRALATGSSISATGNSEAVVWTIELNSDGTLSVPGMPWGLGTLDHSSPFAGSTFWSEGFAINNLGDVCGESNLLPFVAPNGVMMLPVNNLPRGTAKGSAMGINDLNEIVGSLAIEKRGRLGPDQAYHWRGGEPIDLIKQIDSTGGWERLHRAEHINNSGIIAGQGVFDVDFRGFLLIPNTP